MKNMRSKRAEKLGVVVGAIIVVVLLAGIIFAVLFAAGIIRTDGTVHATVFVVSPTQNSRSINFDNNLILDAAIGNIVRTYGFYAVVVADGSPDNNRAYPLSELRAPGTIERLNNLAIRDELRAKAITEITDFLRTQKANVEQVDMLRALDEASRILQGRPADRHEVREIHILGTGLSTTGLLNFVNDEAGWLYTDPSPIVTFLFDTQNMPNLEGISVVWHGMHDVYQPQQELGKQERENLEEIWRLIITNSGGQFFLADSPPGDGGNGDNTPYVSEVPLRPNVAMAFSVLISPPQIALGVGHNTTFQADVTGINDPSQEVIWSIQNNNDLGTMIDSKGVLTIATSETSKELAVTARSVLNENVNAEAKVVVYEIIESSEIESSEIESNVIESSVIITPTNMTGERGGMHEFTATVTGAPGISQEVTWEVTGNASSGTTVSQDGILYIDYEETASLLMLSARAMVNVNSYNSVPVVITPHIINVNFRADEPSGTVPYNNGNPYFIQSRTQVADDIEKWADFILAQETGVFLYGCTAKTDGSDNERLESHRALGFRRAEAVREVFINEHGIDPSRIISVGLGYDNPWHIFNGTSGEYWIASIASQNRRVVIMSADDPFAKAIHDDTWRNIVGQ